MINLEDIKKYEEYIIKMRREFHMYPEVAFHEFRTSKRIKEELEKMNYEIIHPVGTTGILAILNKDKAGKTVALRADFDALSMQEENTYEYKSQIDGMMHSCGHDTHTAMLLGAAKYFSDHKEAFNGTIKLIFQHAEEYAPGGAIDFVKAGLIDDCDAVFGLHITTRDKTKTVNIKKGPAMAAPDEFKVMVQGFGTHASAPHTGIDPILVSSQVVQAFQNIISRFVSPLESAVITVSTIHGGTAFNIIPEFVEMTGTIRTLNPDVRKLVFTKMHDTCDSIAKMNNANITLQIDEAYPPVINDPIMSDFVLDVARKILPEDQVIELKDPSMGGEDFSHFLEKKPGALFWLGAGKTDDAPYNHNPKFDPDEDAFLTGTLMHINIVKEFLNN